ncbi:MAG: serine hydrolase domain-containing protein [Acidimicrobiales bacterium]
MLLDPVDPEEAGVDPARLDVFLRRVRLEVEHGTLPSAQVAVARHGRLVAFETIGAATPATRYILQSVGRTIVAAVVWKLLGDGLLGLGERVGDVIPEFATNGKDVVTVEQVLTHTAGFPFAPLGYPKMLDRSQRLEAFSKWRLDWEPGSRLQFHLTGAAWLIAELVERRSGLVFSDYLHRTIVEPLGLGLVLPVPADRYDAIVAVPVATDRTSEEQQVDPWGPWFLANAAVLAAGEPSHSIVGTAADVALFYQALFHSGLWDADVVADATRIRVSAQPAGDRLYGGSDEIANLGLFCMVSGDVGGSWTPRTGSPRTFGNGGAPCQLAFMDPEAGTSFAFLTNGYPLAGYDYSAAGVNRIINIGNLGNDLVAGR